MSPETMPQAVPASGFQLRSLLRSSGELELSLVEIPNPEPGPEAGLFNADQIALYARM